MASLAKYMTNYAISLPGIFSFSRKILMEGILKFSMESIFPRTSTLEYTNMQPFRKLLKNRCLNLNR